MRPAPLAMLRSALRPAARALSCWAPASGDRVLLRGLLFHAHHGVLPAERTLGQKFELDLALSVDLRAAGASDALEDTISYAEVYECAPTRFARRQPTRGSSDAHTASCVREVVQGPPKQLVEAVAEQVAAAVLRDFPAASAVAVRVVKPHVAMPGALHSLGARARTRMHAEQSNTRC